MTWRNSIQSIRAALCSVRSTFVAISMAHAMTNKSRICEGSPGT